MGDLRVSVEQAEDLHAKEARLLPREGPGHVADARGEENEERLAQGAHPANGSAPSWIKVLAPVSHRGDRAVERACATEPARWKRVKWRGPCSTRHDASRGLEAPGARTRPPEG